MKKMKLVADDVAKEVWRVYKTVQHQDWVKLQAGQSELTLAVRQPTPKMLANAEKNPCQTRNRTAFVSRFGTGIRKKHLSNGRGIPG